MFTQNTLFCIKSQYYLKWSQIISMFICFQWYNILDTNQFMICSYCSHYISWIITENKVFLFRNLKVYLDVSIIFPSYCQRSSFSQFGRKKWIYINSFNKSILWSVLLNTTRQETNKKSRRKNNASSKDYIC